MKNNTTTIEITPIDIESVLNNAAANLASLMQTHPEHITELNKCKNPTLAMFIKPREDLSNPDNIAYVVLDDGNMTKGKSIAILAAICIGAPLAGYGITKGIIALNDHIQAKKAGKLAAQQQNMHALAQCENPPMFEDTPNPDETAE